MRDIRHGEHLWQSWDGDGYTPSQDFDLIYFTLGSVDVEHELVRRALASTLQRDGIVDSLSDGFKILENSKVDEGFAGILEGELEYTACDEDGETEYGDFVEEIFAITWVEIRHPE